MNTSIHMLDVLKPDSDKRNYGAFKLANELRVLMISDTSTDKSAACLQINTGHLCDPPNFRGLAHFCEHMLFLGTEKFPNEHYYKKFISEHSGMTNAYTSEQFTAYYFDINPAFLSDALEIFSSFFTCPLFTESAMSREIEAIIAENEKNFTDDTRRLAQIDRLISSRSHPYSRCVTGNRQSLLGESGKEYDKLRDQLIRFHSSWYSANQMSLVILGKEPLSELQSTCARLFGTIEDKNIQKPAYPSPWTQEYLGKLIYMEPFKDTDYLRICWPIDDQLFENPVTRQVPFTPNQTTQSADYITFLFNSESPGSLFSLLKRHNWASTVSSYTTSTGLGYAALYVSILLTKNGLARVFDVIHAVYQFIELMKLERPQEWIFNEFKALREVKFRFKESGSPINYVETLARNMLMYELPEVIYGPYKFEKFSSDKINQLLSMLNPLNSRTFLVSRSFRDKCTLIEPWYSTRYHVETISSEFVKLWTSPGTHPRLSLPVPNQLIATDFTIIHEPTNTVVPKPELLTSTSRSRLWFAPDGYFQLPKTFIVCTINSPLSRESPLRALFCRIYVSLINDALAEHSYQFDCAGMNYGFYCDFTSFVLTFSGYSHKLPELINLVLAALANFQPSEDGLHRFSAVKERLSRHLSNLACVTPSLRAALSASECMASNLWPVGLLKATLASSETTFENFVAFLPELFTRVFLETLIYGNISNKNAKEIHELFENQFFNVFDAKTLTCPESFMARECVLPEGTSWIFKQKSAVDSEHCVYIYLQCPDMSVLTSCLLELFTQFIEDAFVRKLRTEENLGYTVLATRRRNATSQGLVLIVQSSRSPELVNERIEAFLHDIKDQLKDLSQDQFETHVNSVVNLFLEQPKSMGGVKSRLLEPISNWHYNFDLNSTKAKVMRSLSKDDLLQFYFDYVSPSSSKIKRLTVVILPSNCDESSIHIKGIPIEHVNDLKGRLELTEFIQPKVFREI